MIHDHDLTIATEYRVHPDPLLMIDMDAVYIAAANQADIKCGEEARLEAALTRALQQPEIQAAIYQAAETIVEQVTTAVVAEIREVPHANP